jgi:hypothetical protein
MCCSLSEAVVKRVDVHLDSIFIEYPKLSVVWADQGTVKNWLSLFSSKHSNCMLCYESLAGLVVSVNSHEQFYVHYYHYPY